ncbi:MAG: type II toxin-antitoxin system RelE family toxin [Candidatus Planktophila sp.]
MYALEFEPEALKFLKKMNSADMKRIRAAVELLRINPIPPKALKLTNRNGYRVRVGNYRIIYSFKSDILVIRVIKIGQRQNFYKK